MSLRCYTYLCSHIEKLWCSYFVLLMFVVCMLVILKMILILEQSEALIRKISIRFKMKDLCVVELIPMEVEHEGGIQKHI